MLRVVLRQLCWNCLIFATFLLIIYYISSTEKKGKTYDSTKNLQHLPISNKIKLIQDVTNENNVHLKDKSGKSFEKLQKFCLDERDVDIASMKTKYHCRTTKLGCFTVRDWKNAPKVAMPNMTQERCISLCSNRHHRYAGLMNGEICLCSKFSANYLNVNLTNCNKSCSGDKLSVCGGKNTISLYRIDAYCIKGLEVPNDFVEWHRFGCFKSKLDLLQNCDSNKTNRTPVWCILYCGMLRKPMAFIDTKKRCSCGKMTKKLSTAPNLEDCTGDHLQAYNTLVEDPKCSEIKLLPASRNRNQTVLLSLPGSGNTWIRYLLEKATGVHTGSIYFDTNVDRIGFFGETRRDQLIVVKDHMLTRDCMESYHSAILVIRNPYDAMIAEYNRRLSRSQTGHASEAFFKGERFQKYMNFDKTRWAQLVNYVIKSKKSFLIVYYEDVIANVPAETRRMVDFLVKHTELEVDDLEQRLLCVQQRTTGRAKRKSKKLEFDPFTKEMKLDWNKQIRNVRQLLIDNGFDKTLPKYEKTVI